MKKNCAQVAVSRRMIGVRRKDCLVFGNRLVILLAALEHDAQVVMRSQIGGIQSYRLV